jgi:hypothetical protein
MLSYYTSLQRSYVERYVYDLLNGSEMLDSVSNEYRSDYTTQKAGISYLIRSDKLNLTLKCEYQYAILSGRQVFLETNGTKKEFKNLLPGAFLNYRASKTGNLSFYYFTFTFPPMTKQLLNVVDVSNSTNFSVGNPDLKPQYLHNAFVNYGFANSRRMSNFNISMQGQYIVDQIGNSIIFVTKDTVILGQKLMQNGQLTKPVNLPGSWNTNLFMNYGFLSMPLKCNFTINGGAGYSTRPGYVNNLLSKTKSYELSAGLVIASNISDKIDFTGSYNMKYILAMNSLNPNLDANIWKHNINLKSDIAFRYGIVLQNILTEEISRGLANNYNIAIWNISLGKMFLKDNKGQLMFSVSDVLDRNKNISQYVSDIYIGDSRSNTIGRYFMLTFTYNFSSYNS